MTRNRNNILAFAPVKVVLTFLMLAAGMGRMCAQHPDTLYIYETVVEHDTLISRDTTWVHDTLCISQLFLTTLQKSLLLLIIQNIKKRRTLLRKRNWINRANRRNVPKRSDPDRSGCMTTFTATRLSWKSATRICSHSSTATSSMSIREG